VLVFSARREDSWDLAAGARASGSDSTSAVPATRSGRVRKNRIASKIPQHEKRVLAKSANLYGTSKPVKYSQREKLVGNMQMMDTIG